MGFNSGFKGLRETELSRIQQYIYSATIEIDINYTQELAFTLSKIIQQDANMYSLLYFCKLLYMFRVVTPPIISSTYNCNDNIWHWSNFGKCSV